VTEEVDDVPEIDLSRLPSGERRWMALITETSKLGDRAERHFLEMKSEIDPTSKEGAAKIAKFILGAANRDTVRAGKYLDGHAIMLLGVAEGAITGLTVFEAKDMEDAVRQYLGEPAPQWDFHRVRVSDERDVIVISVDPPRDGDPIWMCCKDGPANLHDGDIFIRVDGATRRAKGDELRALQQRRSGVSDSVANLAVTASYEVVSYLCDTTPLDRYLDGERRRLEEFCPEPPKRVKQEGVSYLSPTITASILGPSLGSLLNEMEDDPRSREQYLQEIADWQAAVRAAVRAEWAGWIDDVVAYKWPGMQICVLSDKYLEEVEVDIHLDGPVHVVGKPGAAGELVLPSPPQPWGPQRRSPLLLPTHIPAMTQFTDYVPPMTGYEGVGFRNSGSVDLEVRIKQLRPGKPYLTPDDEFILLLPSETTGPVTGTWKATAKGHHQQYGGEIEIAVAETVDLTENFDRLLTRRAERYSEKAEE
jgi:hypothetical protein